MDKKKFIRIIPFLIAALLVVYCWCELVFKTTFAPDYRHWSALIAVLVIAVVYFKNFKWGIMLTMLFLVLASFSVMALDSNHYSVAYFFQIGDKEVSTPDLQSKAILLLILFFILNGGFLMDMWADRALRKEQKNQNPG